MADEGLLIIDYGDLPSLVALGIEREPTRAILWHPGPSGNMAGARRSAIVEQHATAFDVVRWIESPQPTAADRLPASTPDTQILIGAGLAAAGAGCRRVVWPVQVGLDPGRIGASVERASLVTEILALDLGRKSVTFDLPLVDVADEQLVDLAADSACLGAGFWPCLHDGNEPCLACDSCRRWVRAFETAVQPWPWSLATA